MALLKIQDLGPKIQERINNLFREIRFDTNRILFWESLSKNDKTKLKKIIHNQEYHVSNKTLPNASIPHMWNILHGEPEIVGVIKVAFQLDIISRSDRDELIQKIGYNASPRKIEKEKIPSSKEKPFWYQQEGKLYYKRKVVLSTQRRKNPSHIQIILQEFELEGWPNEINNPFIKTNYRIKDGIEYLNDISEGIRFSMASGGNCLCWSVGKPLKK